MSYYSEREREEFKEAYANYRAGSPRGPTALPSWGDMTIAQKCDWIDWYRASLPTDLRSPDGATPGNAPAEPPADRRIRDQYDSLTRKRYREIYAQGSAAGLRAWDALTVEQQCRWINRYLTFMEEGEASTHHLEAPDTTPIVPVARAVPLPPPETRGGGGRNQSQTTTVRDQRRGTTDPGWYESYWGVVGALFIEGAVLIGIGIPLAIIIAGVGAIIGGLFYWALALLMAVTFPVWAILEWIVWKPFLWVLERTFGVVEIPASRAWEWMRARARQPVERFGQTRIANTRTGHVIRRASTPVGVVAGLAIVAIAVFAALTSAGAIGDKGAAGRGPQELSADPYAAAAADYESYFQTPSRNIRCSYTSRYVSCHVRSTGQTVSIHAHGVVRFETRPPKFPYPITDVAAYGNERYAETAGITCYSKSSGLTCLARNNTGFEADRSGVHLVGED